MRVALTGAGVLTPDGVRDGPVVLIEGGRIARILSSAPPNTEVVDLSGLLLAPGFIDIQVNGGGGKLFNDDPSVETIACMAAAHRRFGTTGMLPTLITDDLDQIEKAISAVDQAIAEGVPGVLGIHLEGPFIAPSRKGAHREERIRVLEDSHIGLLKSLRNGLTHITLAPEAVTVDQISSLAAEGIKVSLGHTNADYQAAGAALDAGATGFTHLFNAMSQLTNREPGVVGAAFASRTAFAGIIVDGEHVHPASVEAAFNALGPDRLMLVTDAMSLAATDLDYLELQGRMIRKVENSLRLDDGTLAGSNLTMIDAVKQMAGHSGVTLEAALAMASATPAKFLGLSTEMGRIQVGMRADLVALNRQLDVAVTWVGGEMSEH